MPDDLELDSEDFDIGDIGDIGESSTTEQQETTKTVKIREKLSKRKNGESTSSTQKSSGKGGFITPLLILLLVIVGVLLLIQLRQLSESINAAMLGGGADVAASDSSASYEYAIDFVLDDNISDRMAARGRDGWQVVGSRRTADSTSGLYGYEFIFMRRVQGR